MGNEFKIGIISIVVEPASIKIHCGINLPKNNAVEAQLAAEIEE